MTQTVLITGVSAGLGAAFAGHYLAEGADVLGCSRRRPEQFREAEGFHFEPIDLSDLDGITGGLSRLCAGVDRCDLVILNAGILSPFGDMREARLEECQHVLNVNLWANKVLLDWLLSQIPVVTQVVAISSGAGIHGNRGWNAYAISKAALNMLIRLYAAETPATHFTAVAPGPVETAMQEYLCQLPGEERFPTLASLKQRRHTDQMPRPEVLAPRLASLFTEARQRVPSGEFIDIRRLPW